MFNSTDRLIGSTLLLINALAFAFFVATFPNQGHALEIQSYKSNTSKITLRSADEVSKAYNSNVPFCLKEGSKIVTVNNAFKKYKLGYKDCSNSARAARIHAAQGITVNVFKLSELPLNMIRDIKAKLNK